MLSFSTSLYSEPTTFGEYIKKARLQKGQRQKDLARLVGAHEQTIANWERSVEVPMHNYPKVKEAWEVLEVSYDEVLEKFCSLWKDELRSTLELLKMRIRSGLTQKQAAKQAGVDPATLGKLERAIEVFEMGSPQNEKLLELLAVSL